MPGQATGAERRPMVVVEWLRSGVNMPLLVTGLAFAGYTLIYGNPYSYYVMAIAGSYALLVIGFQFIFGHAGAVSLAQAAFFGIGAYISGLLGIKLGWSFHYTFRRQGSRRRGGHDPFSGPAGSPMRLQLNPACEGGARTGPGSFDRTSPTIGKIRD